MDSRDEFEVRLVGGSQPDISDIFLALFDKSKRGQELRQKFQSDPEKAAEFQRMQEMVKHGEQGRVLKEKYQSAQWLLTAVEQRERTLLRVSKAIVEAQKTYLAGRSDAPAPLMMQAVADKVGIDISTVCRAVRDKYIDTPIGLKPLRMLFARGGGRGVGGAETSNVHIKNRIREMMEAEDKKKPLKDDEIQSMLSREGIEIKRRTVAKHRAELGFPNHSQRKQF
jgi:RNA polymerase sigma-54 factor